MKRQIFYFSYYKNGVLQGNCGYVRMLIHNGVCRMDIHIDKVRGFSQGIKGYFFCQQESQMIGYPLFEAKLNDGNLQLRCECNYSSVANEKPVYEMDGMILFGLENKSEYIVMTMRNVEIQSQNFLEYVEKSDNKSNEINELQIEEKISTKNTTFPQENVEKSENSVYEYDEECLKQKREENKTECNCDEEMVENQKEEYVENLQAQNEETLHTEEIKTERDWQSKIFHSFPKVRMRINGEDVIAVKMRPHDIVWMPNSYWRLASNPFLLNGYYNYRYIIFFLGKDGNYYLGVPGCFGIHDAMNAKKFGFMDFFAVCGCMESMCCQNYGKDRKFGYWVICLSVSEC